jgi:hypothetical protein
VDCITTMWIAWPIFKLYDTTIWIENMPKTLSIFTLWSIQALNHIVNPPSLPHPKSTMHHPSAVQHLFCPNHDGARSKSIPYCLFLHCHDSCSVIIIQPSTPQSMGVGAFSIWGLRCCCFLDKVCFCCCCVCYTHIFVIWTSPSIRTLNSCGDVQRSYKHNLWQFLLQVQTGQSWYSKFFNSSHSQYLRNLLC